MSAVRSSELHRAGSTTYRCGPCRRGRHDHCIAIRCHCSETPHCGGGVDLDQAEQTLRRIQAERAAAEPATPTALVRPASAHPTQREKILRHLAAHGPVISEEGRATGVLAARSGLPRGSLGVVLPQMVRAGLVDKDTVGRRTYSITITADGCASIGVDPAALGSSAGSSVADGATSPPASVQLVGGDNPAGAVADGPADEPSGVSGGQGSPSPAVPDDDVPRSPLGPSPEAPVDVEMALLAERLRGRLRRSLVLAVTPFIEGRPDGEWFVRLFDLFDLGEPER